MNVDLTVAAVLGVLAAVMLVGRWLRDRGLPTMRPNTALLNPDGMVFQWTTTTDAGFFVATWVASETAFEVEWTRPWAYHADGSMISHGGRTTLHQGYPTMRAVQFWIADRSRDRRARAVRSERG